MDCCLIDYKKNNNNEKERNVLIEKQWLRRISLIGVGHGMRTRRGSKGSGWEEDGGGGVRDVREGS